MKRKRVHLVLAAVLAAVGVAGFYVASDASAGGVPQDGALTYSGTLLDPAGNPLSGPVDLNLDLFSQAEGGAPVCFTTHAGGAALSAGRFRLTLDGTCTQAVHDNPNLYVEVRVGGGALPRAKIGAVPYSLEAARVVYRNPQTGGVYSMGGTYCGKTQGMQGSAGGYVAAKAACQAACGAPTAHMCTSEEMLLYVTTGGAMDPSSLWISSGHGTEMWNGSYYLSTDCAGWNSADPHQHGALWQGDRPGLTNCDSVLPAACCN